MNITKENIDDLNATITVAIAPEDYQENYNNALRDTRRKVNMPGFRQGKVPLGMVKKMYGRSLLAEEMNRLINEHLTGYINENNLPVLGSPLPDDEKQVGDWDNPGDFEFAYSLGLAPEFKIEFGKKDSFTYHKIKVDEDLVQKQVDDLCRRHGQLVNREEVSDTDLITGDFIELDETGEIKEGGIMNQSSVALEFLKNEEAKKQLIGKKVGEIVVVNPKDLSRGDTDLAAMLGVDKDALEGIGEKFNLRIGEIRHMEKHELNQELYDKVFGEGEVDSEAEFRSKIEMDLEKMFVGDTDRMFQRDLNEQLVDKLNLQLPDAFLKRYIQTTSEKEITDEQVEAEYDAYAKGLRWQLIQNKIIKDNNLKVEEADALNYTKGILVNQYAQYGMPAPEDSELEESAKRVLSNPDEGRRVFDTLYDQKVLAYFKENLKIENKEVAYDDFVKLASGEQ